MLSTDAIVARAADLLSARFGGPQQLTDPEDLGGSGSSVVLRVRVASNPFLQQRSVVIKYSPATSDPFDDAALIREVVSYQFTTALPAEVRPGPMLLAYDIDLRLLVISDCGQGDTFADLLGTADSAQRVKILRQLGRTLGSIHAGTAQNEHGFDVLLARMLSKHPETTEVQQARDSALLTAIDSGLSLLQATGINVPVTVSNFAREAKRRLLSGQHRAFTPFDLSPDNIILADQLSFLDYEWAGFRDVTFDVACVVAGFPQFLVSAGFSDEETDTFIEAWVREVRDLWPNVEKHDRLAARIVTALIGWALASVAYLYFGSMAGMATQIGAVRVARANSGVVSAEVEAAVTAELNADAEYDILAGGTLTSILDHGGAARRDLQETFSALRRYAAREADPRFADVVQFADDVLHRLNELSR